MTPARYHRLRQEIHRLHDAILVQSQRRRPDAAHIAELKRRKAALQDELWGAEVRSPIVRRSYAP